MARMPDLSITATTEEGEEVPLRVSNLVTSDTIPVSVLSATCAVQGGWSTELRSGGGALKHLTTGKVVQLGATRQGWMLNATSATWATGGRERRALTEQDTPRPALEPAPPPATEAVVEREATTSPPPAALEPPDLLECVEQFPQPFRVDEDCVVPLGGGHHATVMLAREAEETASSGKGLRITADLLAKSQVSTAEEPLVCLSALDTAAPVGPNAVLDSAVKKLELLEARKAREEWLVRTGLRFKVKKGKVHVSLMDLHCTMGHISPEYIKRAVRKGYITGVHLTDEVVGDCMLCDISKTTRVPHLPSAKRAKKIGALIHTDIAGPFAPSYDKHAYFAFFLDDFSNHVYPVLLKHKGDVAAAFDHYCEWLEARTSCRVLAVRSDQGGEFRGVFDDICHRRAITHQVTSPYSAFQNGKSERLNRTIKNLVATNMSVGVPYKFWSECFLYVCTMLNMARENACSSSSPFLSVDAVAFNNAAPDVAMSAPYGCLAVSRLPEVKRESDFHAKGIVGMLIGYQGSLKIKRIWVGHDTVVTSSDVTLFPGVRGLGPIKQVACGANVGLASDIPAEVFFHQDDDLSVHIRNTPAYTDEIKVTAAEVELLGQCAPVLARLAAEKCNDPVVVSNRMAVGEIGPKSLAEAVERADGTRLVSTRSFPEQTLDPDQDSDYEASIREEHADYAHGDYDDSDDDSDDEGERAEPLTPPPGVCGLGLSLYGRARKRKNHEVRTHEEIMKEMEEMSRLEARIRQQEASREEFAMLMHLQEATREDHARLEIDAKTHILLASLAPEEPEAHEPTLSEEVPAELATDAARQRSTTYVPAATRVPQKSQKKQWRRRSTRKSRARRASEKRRREAAERVVLTIKVDRSHPGYLPRSARDVALIPDPFIREKWIEAMEKEVLSFSMHKVYTPVLRSKVPAGTPILRGVWVFTIKQDGTYKARYTVDGSREVVDSAGDVYAGVVRREALRACLYLIATKDMHAEVLDFCSAYLQGTAVKPVYALPADVHGQWKDHVWSITGNIYGLRTAAKVWKDKLHTILTRVGLVQLEKDDSVYIYRGGDVFSFVVVYVDDCVFASTSAEWMKMFKKEIGTHHKVTFKGDIHNNTFLNVRMRRDREKRTIKLDIADYIEAVCEEHLVGTTREHSSAPAKIHTPLSKSLSTAMSTSTSEKYLHPNFPQMVGCLNYIMHVARPDLSVAVSKLCRHMHAQSDEHIVAVKRTLRYLHTTKDETFVVGGDTVDGEVTINAWTDSDWGTDKGDSVSYSGALVRLGTTPIFWKTSKQRAIARSSTEAELYALNVGTREAMWLSMLMRDMGLRVKHPIEVRCDNEGAICISQGSVSHLQRHVRMNVHYPRDLVQKGFIKVTYAKSQEMLADGLTKELPRAPFTEFRRSLNMCVPQGETMSG